MEPTKRSQRIVEFLKRYERHISSGTLIGGFILDYFTTFRIDLWFEQLISAIYLSVAALCIAYLTFYEALKEPSRWSYRFHIFFLFLLQFVIGGLFSRFFIFYSRSGSIASSWPFMLLIVGLLVGNEVLRKRYLLFAFRMSVFFIALYSFAIFYLPILTAEMSPRIFLASGVMSLIIIIAMTAFFSKVLKDRLATSKKILGWSIGGIFLAINIMYFANIIPPIPLSMEDSGVYHQVTKGTPYYTGVYEPKPWYSIFQRYKKIHVLADEPVFVYSSVFAPTRIKTTIVHEWQYRDEAQDKWVTMSRIPYGIVGGRDGGYRGYSVKYSTKPGRWRVNIKTERGQLIGRVKLEIIRVVTPPHLESKTL